MHSYAFEFYIISLMIISRYTSIAEELDSNKENTDLTDEKQTTFPATEKSDEHVKMKGKISHLEQCILMHNPQLPFAVVLCRG